MKLQLAYQYTNTRTPGFSLYLERPNGSFLIPAILLVAGKVL